ncbi:hypothetical protein PoB_005811800 [Plakobranchus ocellatus]|uniref:Caspase recruitment domain-containing protein n=1 Tax=Plakobranchus ocellatus TaxID=259542 RepID=A0AAV4CI10_9GAST|nr:hypothetical protein PoB_005811800 [Plakobranchus ocellatus]
MSVADKVPDDDNDDDDLNINLNNVHDLSVETGVNGHLCRHLIGEKQHIKAVTANHGDIAGAEVLLDYMARYDNWFSCLLQALSDPDMKLGLLAKRFSEYKAELDATSIALHEVRLQATFLINTWIYPVLYKIRTYGD